jgi:predicted secreted hydrolase
MPTQGEVRLGNERYLVTGQSWMDREWSTSALGKDQVGWDWFSLQLSDGRELMLYQLRRRDGTADPASSGTLIEKDGSTRSLSARQIQIETLGHWKSPKSGSTYPNGWRLRIPTVNLDLTVKPLLGDQELRLSFRYWEGAVSLKANGPSPLSGQGFVELTGY